MQALTTATIEGGVLIRASDVRMQLRKGFNLTLKGVRGARLSSVTGTAWITVERDARDIVVVPGDSFIVPSDELVLVAPLSRTVTLDLQGPRDAGLGGLAPWRSPIAKLRALVGFKRPLGSGVA